MPRSRCRLTCQPERRGRAGIAKLTKIVPHQAPPPLLPLTTSPLPKALNARCLAKHVGRLRAQTADAPVIYSCTVRLACEIATRLPRMLVQGAYNTCPQQLLGGRSGLEEAPLQQAWCVARAVERLLAPCCDTKCSGQCLRAHVPLSASARALAYWRICCEAGQPLRQPAQEAPKGFTGHTHARAEWNRAQATCPREGLQATRAPSARARRPQLRRGPLQQVADARDELRESGAQRRGARHALGCQGRHRGVGIQLKWQAVQLDGHRVHDLRLRAGFRFYGSDLNP